jgi:hypothetical protein
MSKVNNPFTEEPYKGFAKDYIKELQINRREVVSHARRAFLLVAVLSVLFILARENTHAAVTIFSLKVDDLSPLLAVVPVITAFQFTAIAIATSDSGVNKSRLLEVLAAAYPELANSYWMGGLAPVNNLLGGPSYMPSDHWLRNAQVVLFIAPPSISVAEVCFYGARVGWSAASFVMAAAAVVLLLILGTVIIYYDSKHEVW